MFVFHAKKGILGIHQDKQFMLEPPKGALSVTIAGGLGREVLHLLQKITSICFSDIPKKSMLQESRL
jgi:hypothetical protein